MQLAASSATFEVPGYEPRQQRTMRLILDLDHLRCFTAGSVEFEREILGLFAAELPKTLAALEKAETPREWHIAAHTIKGSALGVGACRLAEAAREAERADATGRALAIMRVKAAIAEVIAEAARLELI